MEQEKGQKLRGLQDSGLGSFGSESDNSVTSPVAVQHQHSQNTPVLAAGGASAYNSTTASQRIEPQKDLSQPGSGSASGSSTSFARCSASSEDCGAMIEMTANSVPAMPLDDHNHCGTVTAGNGIAGGGDARKLIRSQFTIRYLGESVLDRRYTQAMLPWVMCEVRHQNIGQKVGVEVLSNALKATAVDSARILFEHKLQTLSRFARSHQDPKCFVYLTRPSTDAPFTCHVFQSLEESVVCLFYSYLLFFK